MSISSLFIDGSIYLGCFIMANSCIWTESSKGASKYRNLFSLVSEILFILFIGTR